MTQLWSIDLLVPVSGLFVGLLVGQTGMGGGALMTPILVLLFSMGLLVISMEHLWALWCCWHWVTTGDWNRLRGWRSGSAAHNVRPERWD